MIVKKFLEGVAAATPTRRRVLGVALLLAGSLGSAEAQLAPGYGSEATPIAPAGVFIGGFCVLPGGNYALYDGVAIVEKDPSDGSFVRTLYQPPSTPFGAFLVADPSGSYLYFAESSVGSIREIDLGDLSTRLVTNLSFPYDMAFDPQGRAFVAWSTGIGNGSLVSRLDLGAGTLVDVLHSDEASGPLDFDADGNLVYGFPNTTSWPPPPDLSRVVRYGPAQIDGVLAGGSPLVEADGSRLAWVDGVGDLAFDESGDLFVSDSAYNLLTEIDAESGAEQVLFDGPDFQGITFLHFVEPAAGHAFERYQRGGSGTLIGMASDFFSYNDAVRIEPARPTLSTTPASPVPVGAFDLRLEGGPPSGSVLLFVTGGTLGAEFRGSNGSWPAPLWWGLDFNGGILLLRSFPLDATGSLVLNASNPGLGGLSLGVQGIVGGGGGPLYATTEALALDLQ